MVVPRPIALVTTVDAEGKVNAAPFSFFNAVGGDPPIVVLGLGDRAQGEDKDTARNIRIGHEFVVNIVDEAMATAMNVCGIDFPPGVDEMAAAGLSSMPSVHVGPPRIEQSPANLECREHSTLHIGHNRIILGEVVHIRIRDELVDAESLHVRSAEIHAIGRMHGAGWYTRTDDLFELDRVNYQLWKAAEES